MDLFGISARIAQVIGKTGIKTLDSFSDDAKSSFGERYERLIKEAKAWGDFKLVDDNFNGYEIRESTRPQWTFWFMKDEKPVGRLSLKYLYDPPGSHEMKMISVAPDARGSGLSLIMYDYALSLGPLLSDSHQTPDGKKMWVKMFENPNKYKVTAYDLESHKEYSVAKAADGGNLMALGADLYVSGKSDDNIRLMARRK